MNAQSPSALLLEEKNNIVVSEPGSQVSHYQFGVDSATHPGGYRYQIPNPEAEEITMDYFYQQINGEGPFTNSAGTKLNIIHMIAESFNEAKALRQMIQQRLEEVDSRANAQAATLQGNATVLESNLNFAMSENKHIADKLAGELQKQISKLKTDVATQVGSLTKELTEHLASKTRMAANIEGVEQKLKAMDKSVLTSIQSNHTDFIDSELFQTSVQMLQDQITALAKGNKVQPPINAPNRVVTMQASHSKAKKQEAANEPDLPKLNLFGGAMDSAQKIKSIKLGSKKRGNRFEEDSDDSQPLRFRDQDRSVSRVSDVSMGSEGKRLYLTAQQDIEGRNLKRIKGWYNSGRAIDYKVEGSKIKVSLKDRADLPQAREVLRIQNQPGHGRGGNRKPRGGSRAGHRN